MRKLIPLVVVALLCAHLPVSSSSSVEVTKDEHLRLRREGIDKAIPLPRDVTVALYPPAPAPQAPSASAGPDRTAFVNETLSLNGEGSTGAFDGWLPNSDQYGVSWDFGYGGFTYMGSLTAPVAYPEPGTFTATITVCNSAGVCASDSATITVSAIPEGSITVVGDSGNPVTNATNLCNAISSLVSASNPVIEVAAGVVYRRPPGSPCVLPNRTGSGYLTVRSSAHASLPDSSSRVFPADAANMAIMETGVHSNNPATNSFDSIFETTTSLVNPAHHYRFVGLHFRKTFPTLEYTARAMIDIGTGAETSLSQLAHHIQIDRCFLDGGSTTSGTLRGVAVVGSDIAVVNSYAYRFKGVGLETQAVFIGQGERMNLTNNYFSASAEHVLMGGADPRIVDHVPTDVVVRRNMMQKDLGWCSFCGQYYGVNMVVKNQFEVKIGKRISVQGNLYIDHWAEDQNWAITITVRNQSGNAPWSDISFLDFAHNKVTRPAEGTQILGNDNLNPSQSIDHIIFRHVVYAGVSFYNGRMNTFTITSASGGNPDRISIVRVSSDQNGFNGQGRFIEFDISTGFSNCTLIGSVAQGYFNANGLTGQAAFQRACSTSSFNVTKNGFYQSVGTNPTGNTTVATRSLVGYTNLSSPYDLALLSTSPFLTTGLGGGREGADIDTVNALTVGAESGVWQEGLRTTGLRGKGKLRGKATIR